MSNKLISLIIIFTSLTLSCSEQKHETPKPRFENKVITEKETKRVELYKPEILRKFPHDKSAFTQGLLIYNGDIVESTGQRGQSSLRKVDVNTGEVKKHIALADQYFGEGISIYQNKLYFLTWTSQLCFVYDPDTFEEIHTFSYFTQGWGLTNNESYLIMSDGSSYIRIINPDDFSIMNTIFVKLNDKPVENLNELEFVNGKIYANVWGKDYILIIDPISGEVEGKIDMAQITALGALNPDADVLNGIAYNPSTNTFIVTGKNWDFYFEVKFNKVK